jgi:hypothetical protein
MMSEQLVSWRAVCSGDFNAVNTQPRWPLRRIPTLVRDKGNSGYAFSPLLALAELWRRWGLCSGLRTGGVAI